MAKIHKLPPSNASAEAELRERDLAELARDYGAQGYNFSHDLIKGITVAGNGLHATWDTAAEIEDQIHQYEQSTEIQPDSVSLSPGGSGGSLLPPDPPTASIEVDAAPAPQTLAELPPAPLVPVEEEARARTAALARQVYDAEAQKWVDVTPEMKEREEQARQAWAMTKDAQAVIINEVFERKLYLAAGYETRQQYAEEVWGISRSTAFRLAQSAKRFRSFMPDANRLLTAGESHVATLQHPGQQETAQIIQSTSVSTLYQMTTLEDEIVDGLLAGDSVTLDSGRVVSLRTLQEASARDAARLVKDMKREFKSKAAQNEERALTAEMERDVYRERYEQDQEQAEHARQLERLYGPVQLATDAQLALIKQAREEATRLNTLLLKIRPAAEAPEALHQEVRSLTQRLDEIVEGWRTDQDATLNRY